MAVSSNFKASEFTVMQMNFLISDHLVHLNILSSIWHFCVYFSWAQAFRFITRLLSYILFWHGNKLQTYDVFKLPCGHMIEVSRDSLDGDPSSWVSTLPRLRGHGSCECGDRMFFIFYVTTISKCHVSLRGLQMTRPLLGVCDPSLGALEDVSPQIDMIWCKPQSNRVNCSF